MTTKATLFSKSHMVKDDKTSHNGVIHANKMTRYFFIFILFFILAGNMSDTNHFYKKDSVQREFVLAQNKMYLVFLPISETRFFCPGVEMARIDSERVSIKFVRRSIGDKNVSGFTEANYVSKWNKAHPEDKTFINGKLSSISSSQSIELPSGAKKIVVLSE